MPRYRLVIADEAKAHGAEQETYARGARLAGLPEAVAKRIGERHAPTARPVGTVWTTADTECPDGGINCRHCGDPAHAATCRAAGHCAGCGITHGIAPDSVLARSGLTLEAE